MRLAAAFLGILGLAASTTGFLVPRDYDNNDYYVLHLDLSVEPESIAARLGITHDGPLGELTDHHVFRAPKNVAQDIVQTEMRKRNPRRRGLGDSDLLDGVLFASKQKARSRLFKRAVAPPLPHNEPRVLPALLPAEEQSQAQPWALRAQAEIKQRLAISDPVFDKQWHLYNPVQIGHDVNVTGLWLEGITGHNATVAIVDDGLDMHSLDLRDNYFAAGSYDFNDHDDEPAPELAEDRHGTRCAGEVAAVRNDVCGVGVAYDSKVAGIRILSKPISDADEAEALIYAYQHNQIYSCSWGPPDDGKSMDAPSVLIRRAMLKAIQQGRGGLGSIYVFASGNGAAHGDNCNFDGYTNSIYSITVGAVDRAGKHPFYSEHCSAQLVVTYSSGSGDAIHTTDVGENSCYANHGGTSAAAPLAAGIFALVMQVRPDLTWRDLQYLAMDTAIPIDGDEEHWQETTIGKKFSHVFGYGKIDSYALVEKAKTWEKVKPQAWFFSPWLHVKQDIPQGNEGLVATFDVTKEMLQDANLERLEHVTVTMNINHTRRGDLSVDLVSPENIISQIATARKLDEHRGGYDDWTFMSVVHWGESGVGRWTLHVRDTVVNEHSGQFIDWHLKLWGEAREADKATLLPLPNEDDDADHDVISSTITVPVVTSSAASLPTQDNDEHIVTDPSGHPVRPTKPSFPKPTSTNEDETTGSPVAQETTSSSWISKLPSFGASKTATLWIYGALILILAFCAGLGIYLYIVRRRRIRNDPRNEYDFELLDDEEREALNGEKRRGGGKKGRRTRGGELYDAFAGGSESEEETSYQDESSRSRERLPVDAGAGAGDGHVDDEGEDAMEHYAIGEESDEEEPLESAGRPRSDGRGIRKI